MQDINKVHIELLERTASKSERKNMLDCRLVIAEGKTSELEHRTHSNRNHPK